MVGLRPAGSIGNGRVTFLEEQAQKVEDELNEQTQILDNYHVGMTEPLVDDEGSPRTDIDIYKIRQIRQRIVSLQNEHFSIINRIKTGLVEINPVLRNPLSTSQGFSVDALSKALGNHSKNTSPGELRGGTFVINEGTQAFAIIDSVEADSPAEQAGLMADDQLLQFGSTTHLNFYDMSQIQETLNNYIGQNVLVKVRRQRDVLSFVAVPRPWGRSGLLGCRINKL